MVRHADRPDALDAHPRVGPFRRDSLAAWLCLRSWPPSQRSHKEVRDLREAPALRPSWIRELTSPKCALGQLVTEKKATKGDSNTLLVIIGVTLTDARSGVFLRHDRQHVKRMWLPSLALKSSRANGFSGFEIFGVNASEPLKLLDLTLREEK